MDNTMDEATELQIYIENEQNLYNQAAVIAVNMARHFAKGNYDLDLAIKGWRHLTDNAAKQYHAEFGTPGGRWYHLFPVPCRDIAAEELALEWWSNWRASAWGDLPEGCERIARNIGWTEADTGNTEWVFRERPTR